MLFAKLKVGQEDECDRLLSSSKTLLRYHSPNCGHCIDMEPQWDALQYDKLLKEKMKEIATMTMDEKFIEMIEWCL